MKKLFLLIALSGLIISCEKNNFTLNGTIEKGVDVGDSVYLQYVEKGRPFTLGKDAVKNASFNITGKSDKARLCYLTTKVSGKIKSKAELYVEPGEINIKLGELRSTVSGTFLNTRLQEYKDSIDILDNLFKRYHEKSLIPTLSEKGAEEAQKAMMVLSLARVEYVNKFLEKNLDNIVSGYILSKNYETIDPDAGVRLIARMPQECKSDTTVKHIEKTFHNKIITAEGKMFIDFGVFSNSGKNVKLSEYVGKGKITVLNIYSSKGNNAAKEIEAIKAVADTYKDKVQFVGFGIETNAQAWNAFIEKNNMWWPQMSDLQGWGSQAIFSYGVNVYPYNIIFDKNGRILRKGIKLSELQGYLGGIAK